MSQAPLAAFNFQVDWGGTRTGFAEVSGLDLEIATIEYREGNFPESSARKIPGIPKWANISLKRGVCRRDSEFYDWILTALRGPVERRNLMIMLLDANRDPVTAWKVRNAFPVGLLGPTLDATANEIAIEELIIAHEGFEMEIVN